MGRLIRLALIATLAATSIMVGTQTALACSCIMPDADAFFAGADGVFVGTLIEEPEEPSFGPISSADQVPYVFEISAAYKGDLESPIIVYSARDGASCGLEVGLGHEAALFIDHGPEGWNGSLCSTMSADALLDGPFEPIAFGAAGDSGLPAATSLARWVVFGLLGMGAAAAGFRLVSRRR